MPPDHTIAGKPIYVVENHATVIHAWGDIRAALKIPPLLITLDYHADTRPAFTVAMCRDGLGSFDDIIVYFRSREYCHRAGLVDGKVPPKASASLKNDEHIDAATTGGVIDHAYVISFQEGNPTRKKQTASCSEVLKFLETHSADEYDNCPFTLYDLPSNRIFEVQPTCIPGCFEEDHTECATKHADAAIESEFLKMKLSEIGKMAETQGISNILAEAFILDIDLDYFQTDKSIEPSDATTFYELIKAARAITVATEPYWVRRRWLDKTSASSDNLREKLMRHFRAAL